MHMRSKKVKFCVLGKTIASKKKKEVKLGKIDRGTIWGLKGPKITNLVPPLPGWCQRGTPRLSPSYQVGTNVVPPSHIFLINGP